MAERQLAIMNPEDARRAFEESYARDIVRDAIRKNPDGSEAIIESYVLTRRRESGWRHIEHFAFLAAVAGYKTVFGPVLTPDPDNSGIEGPFGSEACVVVLEKPNLKLQENKSGSIIERTVALVNRSVEPRPGVSLDVLTDPQKSQMFLDQVSVSLSTLPARDRRILDLRFGLTDGNPRTLREVASQTLNLRTGEIGVSIPNVSTMQALALRMLLHPERLYPLIPFLQQWDITLE